MKMPSLKALQSHRASSPSQLFAGGSRSAVWARSNTDDLSLSQLHKFWSGLSTSARRELLRIDKQALFEQVRKNLYCSRCHGLLVEGYAQIVSYGKSLQAGLPGYTHGSGAGQKHISESSANHTNLSLQDDTRDPSVHPWGGLAATRDSMLTVLDCFLDGTPLEVFESARARERERELLYPDACGGGGRGWISQSSGSFGGSGRGHGIKETCALHTARLSCEALVDFWSALGEETRRSLLRMKEEDFIERLMFRFDSKRFCRDCRRNVLREFKELKELKRTRKEPRCTCWFCAADTAFKYEVSESVVEVDWRDCFAGDVGSVYLRFEWALGTAEGKADILGFEDVGLAESVHIDGLDLGSTTACYITVRGWKRDGRCTELSTKAHGLKGQLCVHRRLIVGDGYVSITKGESIQRFFERAEETEEEEDDDAMDKDGNELDGEGSRPQKHAKSPELARDFLLDAATVIFKEQVEKAFREGTARQNAHSIFVCLALSLLEERVRVACQEISTLEKQNKLLEEEEDEKREEEERRERRKLKEKEKKLRRKEKLKGKDREKGKCKTSANSSKTTPNGSISGVSIDNEEVEQGVVDQEDSRNDIDTISARPSTDGLECENGSVSGLDSSFTHDIEDTLSLRDRNGAFIVERTKSFKRRSQSRQPQESEGSGTGQANTDTTEPGGCARNPARVAPSPVMDTFSVQDMISSLHVHTKNHKHDVDNLPKSLDSWHRNNSHPQQRLDDFQHCGCGGTQTNLHAKGKQRNLSRVGSNEFPSSKTGERLDARVKGWHGGFDFGLGYSQDKVDGSKWKVFAVPPAKRKGEREQENVEIDIAEMLRPGRSGNAARVDPHGETPTVGHGLAASCGSFVQSHGNNAPKKYEWVHSSISGGPVSRSASFVDHGNSKGISIRPAGRARPASVVYSGKASVATVTLETAGNDTRQVGLAIDQGGVSRNSLVVQNVSNSVANRATEKPHGGTICSDRAREQQAKLNEQAKGLRCAQTGEMVSGKCLVGVEHAEYQPAAPQTLPTIARSEGYACRGLEGDGETLVQKVLSNEVSSQGSIRPTQMPLMIPAPIQVHRQSTFGYYHQSWVAPRARSGVLPLPQPPVSVKQTTVEGAQVGRLPSLSNGLTTLQLKDSIFLSRYGEGPGCRTLSAPPETKALASSSNMETHLSAKNTDGLAGNGLNVPAIQKNVAVPSIRKDITNESTAHSDSTAQVDTTGFSLFHFSSPASVAQKETDGCLNPSAKDNSSEHLSDGSKPRPLKEIAGRTSGTFTPGEYSLFAAAGKGLVFF